MALKLHKRNRSNVLPTVQAKLSSFDLSESLMTTIPVDTLIPLYWQELNPGDRFKININALSRLMPLVAPIMSDVKLKFGAFWVPNSLIWDKFYNFMGEKVYPDTDTELTVPNLKNVTTTTLASQSIGDYLGLPIGKAFNTGEKISSLPFRAYNKIWNDWFRAIDLQEPVALKTDSTEDDLKDYKLLKVGKPMDFFTSALTSPQSGEAINIPLVGNANIHADSVRGNHLGIYDSTGSLVDLPTNKGEDVLFSGDASSNLKALYADMSAVSGVSIESLRRSSAIQVLLERDNRYGERYQEIVKAHWGVDMPDWLAGRSIFLGSATSNISVNPIVQSSSTDSTSPQGNLAGLGVGVESEELCEVSAFEHGHLMILCWASSIPLYFQGLDRKFSKRSRYDYYFPEFQNLGDEVIKNKEIFVSGNAEDEKPFGYQERYRELRESIDKVSGLMRPNVENSLAIWHLAEQFANLPKLGDTFIASNTPIDRVLAVKDQPPILLNCYFDVLAVRPLSVSGNPPMLVGHF